MPSPRDIFAIVGLPPEVLAVAMAKYSRCPEGIKETIDELTEEKSSEFHEKWVLGYGDASVSDMAVVALAFENVSILASKVIEDNRIAAYQEKSTRYQPFDPERFYRPKKIMDSPHATLYEQTARNLFAAYQQIIALMERYYGAAYPKPQPKPGEKELSEKLYSAKLRARALDVARYILPTASLTNFGMIASARTLRHAVSKCLASPLEEMQEIGRDIERAATAPAYNPQIKKVEQFCHALRASLHEEQKETFELILNQIKLQVKGAPTLLKHTEAKQYLIKKQETMRKYVKMLNLGEKATLSQTLFPRERGQNNGKPRVDFISGPIAPENELLATLLYHESDQGFREILRAVCAMPGSQTGNS